MKRYQRALKKHMHLWVFFKHLQHQVETFKDLLATPNMRPACSLGRWRLCAKQATPFTLAELTQHGMVLRQENGSRALLVRFSSDPDLFWLFNSYKGYLMTRKKGPFQRSPLLSCPAASASSRRER